MNYDSGISLGFDVRQFLPLNVSAWNIAGNVLASHTWESSSLLGLKGSYNVWHWKDMKMVGPSEGWMGQGQRPRIIKIISF